MCIFEMNHTMILCKVALGFILLAVPLWQSRAQRGDTRARRKKREQTGERWEKKSLPLSLSFVWSSIVARLFCATARADSNAY